MTYNVIYTIFTGDTSDTGWIVKYTQGIITVQHCSIVSSDNNCCIVKMAGPNLSQTAMAIEEAGGKHWLDVHTETVACL